MEKKAHARPQKFGCGLAALGSLWFGHNISKYSIGVEPGICYIILKTYEFGGTLSAGFNLNNLTLKLFTRHQN